jgi:hypothetical protein
MAQVPGGEEREGGRGCGQKGLRGDQADLASPMVLPVLMPVRWPCDMQEPEREQDYSSQEKGPEPSYLHAQDRDSMGGKIH